MRVPLDDPRLQDPLRPKAAPVEYAGKWVAWDDARENVVAAGSDMEQVHKQAISAGVKRPLLQKVPRPDRLFIGRA